MSDAKQFGVRLRAIVEQAGINQVELATKAGISAMHLNHFVNGRRMPSVENLARLLRVLWWVDARKLICGPAPKPFTEH